LWATARFDDCRDCGERRITSPVSELLPERVSSELPHLQVKLAAQLPYRQVAAFSFGNQIYICTATRYHNLVKSTVSYSLQCPNSLGWEYLPRPYHSGVRTCTLPKLRVKCSVSRSSLIYKGIGNARVSKFLGTCAADGPNLPWPRASECRRREISCFNL
jgi:hypothetical protein